MQFKLFLESFEIPSPPGTEPIPANHVRLYHYVNPNGKNEEEVVSSLKQHGLDIKQARGESYGEGNVIWGTTRIPNLHRIFVEFSVDKNDPRWLLGKGADFSRGHEVHATFGDSIKPEEFIAIHVPWHQKYYYLIDSNKIQDVLNGKFDYILKKPESDEAKAINYIKHLHGQN